MSLTSYPYSRGFQSGEFHHAVLSISGSIHTLYLDGSAVAVNPSAGDIFANNSSITTTIIGANSLLQNAFQGFIGDFRVYNSAISSTQVSNLYMNRNLVVHYPFDSSVNKLTPNYATLTYDASFVGNAALISPGFIGTSALSITNTGGTASQYVLSNPSFTLNATTGFTISCWVYADITANAKIMRIFDIPYSDGIKGISVDLSGTNMIYSSYNPRTIIDKLSASTYAEMTGANKSACAFALKLVNSNYTGAIVKIRQIVSGVTTDQDFYTDAYGINFGTDYLGTGTSLTSWLNGATAYVVTWYNQVRIGQDATAGNSNLLPILSNATITVTRSTGQIWAGTTNTPPTGYYINFQQPITSNYCYFNLPDGILPNGAFNSPYTYVAKTYIIPIPTFNGSPNSPVTMALIGGGSTIGSSTQTTYRGVRYTTQQNVTYGYGQVMWNQTNDQSAFGDTGSVNNLYLCSNTNFLNDVATFTCSSTGRNIYVNGVLKDTNTYGNSNTKTQPTTNNYIGYIYNYTSTSDDGFCSANIYSIYALPIDLKNNPADRIILEST